jgi:lactaldehyde dehydrogenase/glycolaldehyde dehydrogenase
MSHAIAGVRHYEMLIEGEFVSSSKTLQVVNPSTEQVIAEFPNGTVEDADRAVRAAERAQKPWAALPAIQRAGHLREIAGLIRAHREDLANVITEEQGKILSLAQVEVDFSADYLEYMAEFARRYEGEIIQSDRPGENILLYKAPIGVIAGILPWNPSFSSCARWRPPSSRATPLSLSPAAKRPTTLLNSRNWWQSHRSLKASSISFPGRGR